MEIGKTGTGLPTDFTRQQEISKIVFKTEIIWFRNLEKI
jgi:hypothetical protein